LVLGNQPEEQVERPLEHVEMHLEAGLARAAPRLPVPLHCCDHEVPAGAGPAAGLAADSRSRRASVLDSTPASRSASSAAMASRTILPRSTLRPRARRVRRARSRSSSSSADRYTVIFCGCVSRPLAGRPSWAVWSRVAGRSSSWIPGRLTRLPLVRRELPAATAPAPPWRVAG